MEKEQLEVVESINECNIICNGVVGSGKSRIIVEIAKKYELRTLILTYNANLRRKFINDLIGTDNVEVHTYHSFGYKYLSHDCFNDDELRDVIGIEFDGQQNWDVVLIDEAQDMTPLYFELLTKILKRCDQDCKIGVFGDELQAIYEYNGADSRYLTLANKLINNSRPWKTVRLYVSWRLSTEMVTFLNNELAIPELKSARRSGGVAVTHLWMKSADVGKRVADQILEYMKGEKYGPSDIFVLVPSLKKVDYGTKIHTKLAKANIAIFNTGHSAVGDTDLLRSKVVFSTFNKCKGLERKVVFVVGYDKSYYDDLDCMITSSALPSTWYVALTRASELMILISVGSEARNRFPFTKGASAEFAKLASREVNMSVSNLVKEIKPLAVESIKNEIVISSVRKIDEMIELPTKVHEIRGKREIYESVAAINGEFIMTEFWTRYMDHALDWYEFNKPLATKLRIVKEKMYARKAYSYRVDQLENHNWLSSSVKLIDRCMSRLNTLNIAKDNLKIEHPLQTSYDVEIGGVPKQVNIYGRVDLLQEFTTGEREAIWEFKCCKKLEDSHIMQLLTYGFIYWKEFKMVPRLYLYNVLTDQKLELLATGPILENVVHKLLLSKSTTTYDMTNDLFVARHHA